jgi:hypothetical protein
MRWLSDDNEWPPKVGEIRTLAFGISRDEDENERMARKARADAEQRRLEALRPPKTPEEIAESEKRYLEYRRSIRAMINAKFPGIKFETII